eukprot:NODE_174_length_1166_cov_2.128476_g171_i0.p2 GENE.NODE_174_length_1166_cov_2.128476_g171_i0~~NODE_174_length_1166_cov_2.128476_g171_i0.p2  ORF type:complete len:111 (-),score=12.21 NODE_174_length_1166_cov_2.128476_g171_i0:451-783(-)
MDIQRIRNLTTGKLHTDISHVYQDIEFLTSEAGIMTHHLGAAAVALRPFLVERLTDARFWDGKYDTSHQGDVEVHPLTEEELKLFWPAFEQGMANFWGFMAEEASRRGVQ